MEASLRSVALTSCSNWVVQRARSKNEFSSFRRLRKERRSHVQRCSPFKAGLRRLMLQTSYNSSRGTLRWMLSCHLHKWKNVDEDSVRALRCKHKLSSNAKQKKSSSGKLFRSSRQAESRRLHCGQATFFSKVLFDEVSSFRSHTSSVTPFKSLSSSIPRELCSGRSQASLKINRCLAI